MKSLYSDTDLSLTLLFKKATIRPNHYIKTYPCSKKVLVGIDQEKAQSEKDSRRKKTNNKVLIP